MMFDEIQVNSYTVRLKLTTGDCMNFVIKGNRYRDIDDELNAICSKNYIRMPNADGSITAFSTANVVAITIRKNDYLSEGET